MLLPLPPVVLLLLTETLLEAVALLFFELLFGPETGAAAGAFKLVASCFTFTSLLVCVATGGLMAVGQYSV